MARPTKLDKETLNIICRAMEVGATRKIAAQAAGIHVATLYSWLSMGREGNEQFIEFYERVKKAEGLCALRDLAIITRASETDWRAAGWRLERRFGYTVNQPPKEEVINEAVDLDVNGLLSELSRTNDLIEKLKGPKIDIHEE